MAYIAQPCRHLKEDGIDITEDTYSDLSQEDINHIVRRAKQDHGFKEMEQKVMFGYLRKQDLKELIPGLSKWRIDQARTHAAEATPGKPEPKDGNSTSMTDVRSCILVRYSELSEGQVEALATIIGPWRCGSGGLWPQKENFGGKYIPDDNEYESGYGEAADQQEDTTSNYSLNAIIYDLIKERKKSVCRINWPGGSGTGFLLSKGKVLTCYHVYEGMVRARRMFTDLGLYTATFVVSASEECKVRFHFSMLKGHCEELDYAILKLAVDDEVESTLDSLPFLGRFLPLVEDHRKMVVVVGHPYGGDKMVDFCHMAALERHHIIHVMFGNPHFPQEDARKPLYHTGVMFHGSSGSPGFDTQGNVVLMHTRGFFPESLIERGVRLTAIRDHASQTLEPEVFREIFP
ncbi:hypothetical protein Bbelb_051830 [Branchiostoma belcheri]|nr:hypothetical protein Bbelb_051830 [Branchiostoma belcheri]